MTFNQLSMVLNLLCLLMVLYNPHLSKYIECEKWGKQSEK
jgi:hypothetical protein